MRKFLLAIAIMSGLGVYAHAGPAANQTLFLWKSSYTETADSQVLISSEGKLAFGGVFVGSNTNAAIGTGSGFMFVYDNQTWNANMSTVTSLDCSFYPGAVTTPGETYHSAPFLPVLISSGLMYSKTGGCKVNLFWEVIQRNPLVLPFRVR